MEASYKILGVDPGTQYFGFAVIEVFKQSVTVRNMGHMSLGRYGSHQERLKEIFLQLQEVIETHLPGHMAIEAPFYGKNVQSMLKLGRAQGVAIAAAITMGLSISEYSPKKIKMSITGNGNASKEQVAKMLNQLLKIDLSAQSLDSTDALAAALTHYHNLGSIDQNRKIYKDWNSYLRENPSKPLR